jgi:L-amino acid N-acyltransferase YncA
MGFIGGAPSADRVTFRIRAAAIADAIPIAQVHVSSWRAAYIGLIPASVLDGLSVDRRAEMWRRTLESATSTANRLWVVEVEGRVVGFAATGPTRDSDEDRTVTGEVFAIYLNSQHWGRGIGRALFETAVSEMGRQGFHRATLWVLDANTRTRRFYEAAGWRTDGAVRTDVMEGVEVSEVRYRIALRDSSSPSERTFHS